jgi:hypothetical protein
MVTKRVDMMTKRVNHHGCIYGDDGGFIYDDDAADVYTISSAQ